MKLERQFLAKDNRLYSLEGVECPFDDVPVLKASDCVGECTSGLEKSFSCVELNWSQVGLNEENYNEEFLAGFRDFLKSLEEKKNFVFIVPVADKAVEGDSGKEAFVASMKHCARRIKDCACVIGFALPSSNLGIDDSYFIDELSQKHKHYIFFSNEIKDLNDSSVVKY